MTPMTPAHASRGEGAEFDEWLDTIADRLRNAAAKPDTALAHWSTLHPTYREAWRSRARRDVPDLLLRRVLAEYDEDSGRAPSFVTMGLIRAALAASPAPREEGLDADVAILVDAILGTSASGHLRLDVRDAARRVLAARTSPPAVDGLAGVPILRLTGAQLDLAAVADAVPEGFDAAAWAIDFDEWEEFVRLDDVRALLTPSQDTPAREETTSSNWSRKEA